MTDGGHQAEMCFASSLCCLEARLEASEQSEEPNEVESSPLYPSQAQVRLWLLPRGVGGGDRREEDGERGEESGGLVLLWVRLALWRLRCTGDA